MKIRIAFIVLFVLFFVNLPHELGCASVAWNGVSFHYRFKKLGATILKASLSIERVEDLYMVKAAVDSTGVTFPFFRMHNRFRSYIKEEGLEPWLYVKEVNQWGVLSHKKCYIDVLTFDLDGSKVTVERLNPPQVREIPIPPQTYDPLAIFLKYFLEAEGRGGDKIEMRIYDGIQLREVTFIPTRGEISTPLYGEIKTTCLESKVPFSSLGDKEGVIRIWYTDDERRFPVDISLEIPIAGNVQFQLERVEAW